MKTAAELDEHLRNVEATNRNLQESIDKIRETSLASVTWLGEADAQSVSEAACRGRGDRLALR